jgi:hypothetical protein
MVSAQTMVAKSLFLNLLLLMLLLASHLVHLILEQVL